MIPPVIALPRLSGGKHRLSKRRARRRGDQAAAARRPATRLPFPRLGVHNGLPRVEFDVRPQRPDPLGRGEHLGPPDVHGDGPVLASEAVRLAERLDRLGAHLRVVEPPGEVDRLPAGRDGLAVPAQPRIAEGHDDHQLAPHQPRDGNEAVVGASSPRCARRCPPAAGNHPGETACSSESGASMSRA